MQHITSLRVQKNTLQNRNLYFVRSRGVNALKSYWDPGSYCGAVKASTYPRYPVYEDEKGYITLVERMLKQGAGANVASQNGRVFMTTFEKDTPLQLIKMLVEHGAIISHQSKG